MKIIIKIFLLSGLLIAIASAQVQINAIKVPGNIGKIGALSKAWLSAEYTDIMMYPDTTIHMFNNQKSINGQTLKAKKVRVKALYDGKNISLLLEWKDATKDIQGKYFTSRYVDGFAIQFPKDYSDATKLPYISMGSKDRPAIVHLKKAYENNDEPNGDVFFEAYHKYTKNQKKVNDWGIYVMEGYRSVAQIKEINDLVVMDMVYKNGVWKGALSRPLTSKSFDLRNGAFPVLFVTWDGNAQNIDGVEYISSWIGVKMLGERDGYELLDALKKNIDGDIYNGKKLAVENCVACHNFTDSVIAPSYMGPNLSNIGGYATSEYLRESIIEPNAVVVPNYKPNIKKDFPWYNIDKDGKEVSTMPSYSWMDEKSIQDLVTYLKTLKAEVE